MLSTRGQYAWGQDVGVVANGAKYYSSSSHQRLNVEHPSSSWFCQWLVGVTDGDGSFSVIRQNGKWNLAFQIGQSSYNLRLLYYIKRMLGVGSVTVEQKTGMASYRIRDRRALAISIFPLFDRYPLLTTKNFYYDRLKKVYSILEDPKIQEPAAKDRLIITLLQSTPDPPAEYISPAWDSVTLPITAEIAKRVATDPWVIGFTEAEGSFYLVTKEKGVRIVHAFGICQKLDRIVLEAIRTRLGIATKVVYKAVPPLGSERGYQDHDYYLLDTTNSRAIANIGSFLNGQMKGMKAVEFRIWLRSQKHKGKYTELVAVQTLLRKLRSLRPSNALWSLQEKQGG